MTRRVERLDWDSEFFGAQIGRVELGGLGADELRAVDEEARDLGIECLYGSLDPARSDGGLLAQRLGHRLVEVAITFARPAGPYEPPPSPSVARRGTEADIPGLQDSIDTLAPWSRFAVDPRFGPAASRRMFDAWVKRAVSSGDERMLAIAEDETGVTGLSTNVRSPVPRVDLMGVVKPGTGASQALMAQLFEWAGDVPTEAGPCAARNVAVCRFVEGSGFRVSATRYLFHRWLDEDVAH